MDAETLIIKSDDDAVRLLEDLTEGKVRAEDVKIELHDWPKIQVYLKGEKFNRSMTPSVMTGFIELQKNLNKTFALLKYQDSSKRLTPEEKKKFEITVVVDKGSSDLQADLTKPLVELAKGLSTGVQNMDSLHLLVGILGTGLLFAGGFAYKKYLDHRTEVRLKEIEQQSNASEKEVRLRELKALEFAGEQETQRLHVIGDILKSHPHMKPIEDYAYNSHTEILKGSSSADSATIQGNLLGAGIVEELKSNARKRAVDDRLTGIYRVAGSEHVSKDEIRLKLVDTTSSDEIKAILKVDFESLQNIKMRDILKEAQWSRTPVKITLVIRRNHEKITKAIIESVVELEKAA